MGILEDSDKALEDSGEAVSRPVPECLVEAPVKPAEARLKFFLKTLQLELLRVHKMLIITTARVKYRITYALGDAFQPPWCAQDCLYEGIEISDGAELWQLFKIRIHILLGERLETFREEGDISPKMLIALTDFVQTFLTSEEGSFFKLEKSLVSVFDVSGSIFRAEGDTVGSMYEWIERKMEEPTCKA